MENGKFADEFSILHFQLSIAAKNYFWTAGSSSPIRTAIIAMTTRFSMSVKPSSLACFSITFFIFILLFMAVIGTSLMFLCRLTSVFTFFAKVNVLKD